MPEWGLVPSKPSGEVLPGNNIHTGRGVEMLIDKAIDLSLEILDNHEEYLARTRDHLETIIRKNFTWEKVGLLLREVIRRYL